MSHTTHLTLQELVIECQQERNRFRQNHDAASPACLQIFLRALQGIDEQAWQALDTIFGPQILAWIRLRSHLLPGGFTEEDAYQEGFSDFYRGAPKNIDLTHADSINRLLAFWQKCVLNAILQWRRSQHRFHPPEELINQMRDSATWIMGQANPTDTEEIEWIQIGELLQMRIKELIHEHDRKEAVIFQLFFELEIPPRQIYREHQNLFRDYDEVALVIQRLKRRLRADESLKSLYGARQKSIDSTSLFKSVLFDEAQSNMSTDPDNPCSYDETTLLEYVIGKASVEITQAIEGSPACMKVAQAMARELWPLLRATHRLRCPESWELIDYQQRKVTSIRQLEIYRHLQLCPSCQAEITWLDQMNLVESSSLPTKIRRVVEAIFQSPLALPQPVRGEWLRYQTAAVALNITPRKENKRQSWTLRIQLQTLDGLPLTEKVERAILIAKNPVDPDQEIIALPQDSSLIFHGLDADFYDLHVFLGTEEIVIRSIQVGEV